MTLDALKRHQLKKKAENNACSLTKNQKDSEHPEKRAESEKL